MKLYLLEQAYQGYDTYDSGVVAAENEEDAYGLSCIKANVYRRIEANETPNSLFTNKLSIGGGEE